MPGSDIFGLSQRKNPASFVTRERYREIVTDRSWPSAFLLIILALLSKLHDVFICLQPTINPSIELLDEVCFATLVQVGWVVCLVFEPPGRIGHPFWDACWYDS